MLKKFLAGAIIGGALLVAQPMVNQGVFHQSVAEAGVVNTIDGLFSVAIDDSSVYMVGKNHAHVSVTYKNNMKGTRQFLSINAHLCGVPNSNDDF